MATHLRILILEDFVDDVELIEYQLKKGEFSFTSRVVETRDQYEEALAEFRPDVVLSDHSLPMFDSMLALQMFHSYRKVCHSAAVFILVTGTVSEEFAVQIMRNGADDYLLKDRLKRLPEAVLNAWQKNLIKVQRQKEEEDKLHLFDILQRSLHEIYLIDYKDFHFEYANEEAINNLGYTQEELQHMTPADIIDSFNKETFRQALKIAEERTKGLLLERRALRKNGSTYPIQIHLQVIRRGREKRILANVLDITESKKLEEQKELAAFIQNSFSYRNDLQMSLELVLKKLCDSFTCVAAGIYSREFDQPGSKFIASYNPYKKDGSIYGSRMAEKAYETKSVQKLKLTTEEKKKLEEGWLNSANIKSIVAVPLELGGEVVAVMTAFLDHEEVYEKKFSVLSEQIRNKLAGNIKRKKSEEELQKIFNFSPDILMVIGKDGIVRKINPALQKILGYRTEELLFKSFEYLVHPEDKPVLDKWRESELQVDDVAHYESRWLANNGEYKWFSWSVTPYLKGKLHFAVGRDITQSKKHLRAIKEQNKKLAEIAWEQSHIVRAPLTRLLACVEYLEESGQETSEILLSVKSSAYEIDQIIKEIINKSEKVELNGRG